MTGLVSSINSVALIGCGVMGREIGWACARSEIDVRFYDIEPRTAVTAQRVVSSWLQQDGLAKRVRHLSSHETLAGVVAGVDLAFECVPEDLNLKRSVHLRVSRCLSDHALQGSNSSALTPSEIAGALSIATRFFCMNFTHPRSGEKLVEYMASNVADPAIGAIACDWATRIGMSPIVLEVESFGYAQNRIWRAIKKEALFLLANGIASVEDIDRGFVLSWGVPAGPFRIMDKVGLDTVLRIEREYFLRSGKAEDRPPDVLTQLVADGHLGEQSGKGFYSYS